MASIKKAEEKLEKAFKEIDGCIKFDGNGHDLIKKIRETPYLLKREG